MPCLRNDWDPGRTLIKNMQIESHEHLNEWRNSEFGWPRGMSSGQKNPVINQGTAAGGENP
jgi:hypothetical protein